MRCVLRRDDDASTCWQQVALVARGESPDIPSQLANIPCKTAQSRWQGLTSGKTRDLLGIRTICAGTVQQQHRRVVPPACLGFGARVGKVKQLCAADIFLCLDKCRWTPVALSLPTEPDAVCFGGGGPPAARSGLSAGSARASPSAPAHNWIKSASRKAETNGTDGGGSCEQDATAAGCEAGAPVVCFFLPLVALLVVPQEHVNTAGFDAHRYWLTG